MKLRPLAKCLKQKLHPCLTPFAKASSWSEGFRVAPSPCLLVFVPSGHPFEFGEGQWLCSNLECDQERGCVGLYDDVMPALLQSVFLWLWWSRMLGILENQEMNSDNPGGLEVNPSKARWAWRKVQRNEVSELDRGQINGAFWGVRRCLDRIHQGAPGKFKAEKRWVWVHV